MTGELPEESIDLAQTTGNHTHVHGPLRAEDGSLAEHLRTVHRLDLPGDMSSGTQQGLHDRLHGESHALDD